MLESTDQSAPDPRVFVKGVLKPSSHLEVPGPSGGTISESDSPIKTTATVKSAGAEPEVDEDGWQVYNPRAFEASSDAVPALELNDIGVISPSVFQELPENIKAELAHFHKLDQAKKLKAAAEERGNNKSQGKKRPVRLEAKEPPPKKKLDAFFKKE